MMHYFLLFLFVTFQLHANPFTISFPAKEELTAADYIEVQNQLRAIDIVPLLKQLYVPDRGNFFFDGFLGRCSRGIKRVLIDPKKGLYPVTRLEKIGMGSDLCIVSCAPYDGVRSKNLARIPDALRATGFNGYFYYRLGGFPNPTGREIQYAGVPYCFKIFMMLEAQQLGFDKVLWIDSSCLPIQDPSPLFQWLDQTGIYYVTRFSASTNRQFLFPETVRLLKELTGVDVEQVRRVSAGIFGLKMDTLEAKSFIEEYYRMVELGTPFLSGAPEEFVFSALIEKAHIASWLPSPFPFLPHWGLGAPEAIAQAKKQGFFFLSSPPLTLCPLLPLSPIFWPVLALFMQTPLPSIFQLKKS